jgi:isopentenyl-diphosphate delta-isomerase
MKSKRLDSAHHLTRGRNILTDGRKKKSYLQHNKQKLKTRNHKKIYHNNTPLDIMTSPPRHHAIGTMTIWVIVLIVSWTTRVSGFSTRPFESSYGQGMNQDDMMESDRLVIVDEHDHLMEAPPELGTKKAGHTFNEKTPRGILHRAFSLFVFNDQNKLLLTQRAASKITFPSVWTNTACSHPLLDMTPTEVDDFQTEYPRLPGIQRAAIRKARHELGLDLAMQKMTFITRFHYWAADVQTHGNDTPWGEHEIDYILFLRLNQTRFDLESNPEEVANIRYVTSDELKDMMYHDDDNQYTWSPWFVGIMERGGYDWWENIDHALEGKCTNTDIQFFDPPSCHRATYNLPSHSKTTGVLKPMTAAQKLASTDPKEWVRIT